MEGSKAFAKDFMARWNIPTAEYRTFDNYELARSYLDSVAHKVVIKANGLYVNSSRTDHFSKLKAVFSSCSWLTAS